MSDGNYDRSLVAQPHEAGATNVRNKQFYDVDLLKQPNEQERHPHQLEGTAAPFSHTNRSLPVEGDLQKVEDGPPILLSQSEPRRRWYKTRNGIIGIVLVLLVVLGAVIGGAVGGTEGEISNVNGKSHATITEIFPNPSNGGTAGVASRTGLTAVPGGGPTRGPTSFKPAPTGAQIVSSSGG